jgi:hypothetical protein
MAMLTEAAILVENSRPKMGIKKNPAKIAPRTAPALFKK